MKHLLPKQRRAHALEKELEKDEVEDGAADAAEKREGLLKKGPEEPLLEMSAEAMTELIQKWTAESGVRSLDRQIATVCRFASLRIAESLSDETAAADAEAIPQIPTEAQEALAACGPSAETKGKVFVLPEHLPHIVGMEMVQP